MSWNNRSAARIPYSDCWLFAVAYSALAQVSSNTPSYVTPVSYTQPAYNYQYTSSAYTPTYYQQPYQPTYYQNGYYPQQHYPCINSVYSCNGSSNYGTLYVNRTSDTTFAVSTRGISNVKVGSYFLTAPSDRDVTLSQVNIQLGNGGAQLSNLSLRVNGTQFGSAYSNTLSNYGNYIFYGSMLLPRGNSITVDVYADVPSYATQGTYPSITTLSDCSVNQTGYTYGQTSGQLRCNNTPGQQFTIGY